MFDLPAGVFDPTTFLAAVNLAWSRDLFLVFNTTCDFIGADDRFDIRSAQLNNRVGVAKLTYVVQIQVTV